MKFIKDGVIVEENKPNNYNIWLREGFEELKEKEKEEFKEVEEEVDEEVEEVEEEVKEEVVEEKNKGGRPKKT